MAFNQQGDLLVKKVGEKLHRDRGVFQGIPADAKPKDSNILAEGEATGHAHRVQPMEGDYELLELGDRLFVRVMNGNVAVIHEEHGQQTLEPGEYEIERVQEYNPFTEAAQNVAD